MPTYVFLMNLTEKGKSNLDEARENSKKLSGYIETLGGRRIGAFMTLGRYDIIEVIELPDDLAALKLSMRSTESGLYRVETLKGFPEEDSLFNI